MIFRYLTSIMEIFYGVWGLPADIRQKLVKFPIFESVLTLHERAPYILLKFLVTKNDWMSSRANPDTYLFDFLQYIGHHMLKIRIFDQKL